MRKGVTIGNRKYSRVATWSSPLVDEIDKTIELTEKSKDYKPKVFGVPVRKADLKTLKAVCHVFMPDIEKGAFYGVSDATDAPYIEAFIRAMKTLPAHTNKIAKAFFSGPYPIVPATVAEEELLQTTAKIDWIEDEFSVSKWKSEYVMIPLQEGNEGNVSVEEATRSIPVQQEVKKWDTVSAPSNGNAAQQQPVQQVQAQAPQVQQPVYQQPIPSSGAASAGTTSTSATASTSSACTAAHQSVLATTARISTTGIPTTCSASTATGSSIR